MSVMWLLLMRKKFLALWRSEPDSIHSDVSMGSAETWVNDRKYDDAVQGFSHGFKNSVPVADIVCQEYLEKNYIYERKYFVFKKLIRVEETMINYVAFTNGITRTIWLLVQGAKYFPVKCCSKDGANRLAGFGVIEDVIL